MLDHPILKDVSPFLYPSLEEPFQEATLFHLKEDKMEGESYQEEVILFQMEEGSYKEKVAFLFP